MPAMARDDLPKQAMEGYEGRFADWGDMTIAFEKIGPGDFAELFKGLPNDRCQSPHWGYLLKGRMTFRFEDHEEIVEAGQAYYMPPGHVPIVEEEVEAIEFSPTQKLQETFAAISKNMEAMPARS